MLPYTRGIARRQKPDGDAGCEWSKDGFDIAIMSATGTLRLPPAGKQVAAAPMATPQTGIALAHARVAACRRRR